MLVKTADALPDPARGSIHSVGMAVDATLLDPHGAEADMGSGYVWNGVGLPEYVFAPIVNPAFGSLLREQYEVWQQRLAKYGGMISPAPAKLPPPEIVITH